MLSPYRMYLLFNHALAEPEAGATERTAPMACRSDLGSSADSPDDSTPPSPSTPRRAADSERMTSVAGAAPSSGVVAALLPAPLREVHYSSWSYSQLREANRRRFELRCALHLVLRDGSSHLLRIENGEAARTALLSRLQALCARGGGPDLDVRSWDTVSEGRRWPLSSAIPATDLWQQARRPPPHTTTTTTTTATAAATLRAGAVVEL